MQKNIFSRSIFDIFHPVLECWIFFRQFLQRIFSWAWFALGGREEEAAMEKSNIDGSD